MYNYILNTLKVKTLKPKNNPNGMKKVSFFDHSILPSNFMRRWRELWWFQRWRVRRNWCTTDTSSCGGHRPVFSMCTTVIIHTFSRIIVLIIHVVISGTSVTIHDRHATQIIFACKKSAKGLASRINYLHRIGSCNWKLASALIFGVIFCNVWMSLSDNSSTVWLISICSS